MVQRITEFIATRHVGSKFESSSRGAASAWRGFSLQTLYIASRIANAAETDSEYYPESVEDLLVINHPDSDDASLELVQVKSSTQGLALSDLDVTSSQCFFRIAEDAWSRGIDATLTLVVFGRLGDELGRYGMGDDGAVSSIGAKLLGKGYSRKTCERIHDSLRIFHPDEEGLKDELRQTISKIVPAMAAPDLVLHELVNWVNTASSEGGRASRETWMQSVRDAGMRLAGVSGLAAQYGKTILPLSASMPIDGESPTARTEEYREGISTRPSHILLELDVPRETWQVRLAGCVEGHSVAIVRAASGQGKTTLAYRYLLDNAEVGNVYVVKGIRDRDAANDIAAALVGIAQGTSERTYAYIEATGDPGWTWVCEQLSERAPGNLKLLVTVREDDYYRSGFSSSDCPHAELRLELTQSEAHAIYDVYKDRDEVASQFPSFDSAWGKFGGKGPLMEFVSMLTTGKSLSERIGAQIDRTTRQDGFDDSWLEALLVTARAGREGAPVSQERLCSVTGRHDAWARMLKTFSDEHLVQVDGERESMTTLHPYRAQLLDDMLSGLVPKSPMTVTLSAIDCSTASPATILVGYLATHSVTTELTDALARLGRESWSRHSAILSAMVWRDTRDLFEASREFREEVLTDQGMLGMKPSFVYMLSGGVCGANNKIDSDTIIDTIAKENPSWEALIRERCREAGHHKVSYHATDAFLRASAQSLPSPSTNDGELSRAAFSLSFFALRGIELEPCRDTINRFIESNSPDTRSLEGWLDFALAYQLQGWELPVALRDSLLMLVERRHTMVATTRGEDSVKALIAAPFDAHQAPNEMVMGAIYALRRLFPGEGYYDATLVGVRPLAGGIDMPDTKKHIPAENLPIRWTRYADPLYFGMCEYEEAPDDWAQVRQDLEGLLDDLAMAVRRVPKDIDRYYEKPQRNIGLSKDTVALLEHIRMKLVQANVSLPRCDLDPHAFRDASTVGACTLDDKPQDETQNKAQKASYDLRKIDGCLNDARWAIENLSGMINLHRGQNSSENQKGAKLSLVNLLTCVEKVPDAEAALLRTFDDWEARAQLRYDKLLELCSSWNYCFCNMPPRGCRPSTMQGRHISNLLNDGETAAARLNECDGVDDAKYDSQTGALTINANCATGKRNSLDVIWDYMASRHPGLREDRCLADHWLLKHVYRGGIQLSDSFEGMPLSVRAVTLDRLLCFSSLEELEKRSVASAAQHGTTALDEAQSALLAIEDLNSIKALVESLAEVASAAKSCEGVPLDPGNQTLAEWGESVIARIASCASELATRLVGIGIDEKVASDVSDEIVTRSRASLETGDVSGLLSDLERLRGHPRHESDSRPSCQHSRGQQAKWEVQGNVSLSHSPVD